MSLNLKLPEKGEWGMGEGSGKVQTSSYQVSK